GLEIDALVARRPHPTDRRATMIELTTDGYAAVEAALGPALGAMSCLFTDLSPEQRRAFAEAMDVLKAGIKPRAPDGPRAGDDQTKPQMRPVRRPAEPASLWMMGRSGRRQGQAAFGGPLRAPLTPSRPPFSTHGGCVHVLSPEAVAMATASGDRTR